jgi:DcuC family C4-dicarboxylate transporter
MLTLGLLVVAAAVVLMARGVEVRLVLLGAGLLLAALAGRPLLVFDEFGRGMVAAMVAPICAAMGFAAVLRATGCDRQLVRLLLAPLSRLRWLALPGGILAAYCVNMAIQSQASTAAALGPVLVPLLLSAGFAPEVAGAALILGASFGGDLLNPAAQDVQAVADAAGLPAGAISARVIPASLAGAVVAAATFALLNRRPGDDRAGSPGGGCAERSPVESAPTRALGADPGPPVPPTGAPDRLQPVRAFVPLLPIALLLLAYAGWPPLRWLLGLPPGAAEGGPGSQEWLRLKGALPVVRAMLIGVLVAGILAWRELPALTRDLFEGMGAAYARIISLTITAQCFGAGIAAIGFSAALARLLAGSHWLTALIAAGFPWSLAVLSGSGSGPVLTYARTFLPGGHPDPATLGAVACLAGAFGRTMSPVAAVVVYSAGLVGLSPIPLVRRLLPALLAGALAALALTLAPARTP